MKAIIGLVIFSITCFGFEYHIKELKYNEDKFPYIISEQSPEVAEKINTSLHLNYLELLPNGYLKNPFEKTVDADGTKHLHLYDYSITQTSPKVLNIQINAEGCGAYCEEFTGYHNYLLSNGYELKATDLFTIDGKRTVEAMLHKIIVSTLDSYLKSLKRAKSKDETLMEQIDMYQECRKNSYKGNIAYYTSFIIGNDDITFIQDRCSNHAMRALDDLGNFELRISKKELEPYMSKIGKELFTPKAAISDSQLLRGLYKGTINGKYPILLWISRMDEGSVDGFYWYQKTKQLIALRGQYSQQNLALQVTQYSNKLDKNIVQETFLLSFKDGILQGSWTNVKTAKTLSVELKK
jgi:hypothetical protein